MVFSVKPLGLCGDLLSRINHRDPEHTAVAQEARTYIFCIVIVTIGLSPAVRL
jgi:hypothetical protein